MYNKEELNNIKSLEFAYQDTFTDIEAEARKNMPYMEK